MAASPGSAQKQNVPPLGKKNVLKSISISPVRRTLTNLKLFHKKEKKEGEGE